MLPPAFYEVSCNFKIYGRQGLAGRRRGAKGLYPNRVWSTIELREKWGDCQLSLPEAVH